MKFNFRRAKTPAYLTSLALIVLGLIFAVASVSVLAWILTILGVALNVMAVSITEITDAPSRARGSGTRVVEEPEVDTEQHETVPAAGTSRLGASSLRGTTAPRGSEGRTASETPRASTERVGTDRGRTQL